MLSGRSLPVLVLLCSVPLPARGADTCRADPCKAGCADLCHLSSTLPGDPLLGVPVRWEKQPIELRINASRVTAGLDRAKVIAAVRAAFKTWESVPCTDLRFHYAGESTSFHSEPGQILVFWGNDKATWTHGDLTYWTGVYWASSASGRIAWAAIGLNATPQHPQHSFDWTVGAAPMKLDIQTAVTWLIPATLGFAVGTSAASDNVPLFYDWVSRSLCLTHEEGATFSYILPQPGCWQPSVSFCRAAGVKPPPPPDMGVWGVFSDDWPPLDISVDAGARGASLSPRGCSLGGQGGAADWPWGVALALVLIALLARRGAAAGLPPGCPPLEAGGTEGAPGPAGSSADGRSEVTEHRGQRR